MGIHSRLRINITWSIFHDAFMFLCRANASQESYRDISRTYYYSNKNVENVNIVISIFSQEHLCLNFDFRNFLRLIIYYEYEVKPVLKARSFYRIPHLYWNCINPQSSSLYLLSKNIVTPSLYLCPYYLNIMYKLFEKKKTYRERKRWREKKKKENKCERERERREKQRRRKIVPILNAYLNKYIISRRKYYILVYNSQKN